MPINPVVAIRIKTRKHQTSTIIGHYRHRRLPGEGLANDTKGIKNQKLRLESFARGIEKLKIKSNNKIIIGDPNLYKLSENQPWLRPEIRALQPTYDKIIQDNSLKHMNPEDPS